MYISKEALRPFWLSPLGMFLTKCVVLKSNENMGRVINMIAINYTSKIRQQERVLEEIL